MLLTLERPRQFSASDLQVMAEAMFQGRLELYPEANAASLSSGWWEGFSIPFVQLRGKDAYRLDTRWLSHADKLAARWFFLMSLAAEPGFRQQRLLGQIPELSDHLSPEEQRNIQAQAAEWRQRLEHIAHSEQTAFRQRPSRHLVSLQEWSELRLAGTNEGVWYNPLKPEPVGARGTHDCVVLALVDTGWREGMETPPLMLYHADPRTSKEDIGAILKDMTRSMRPGATLTAPVIGGPSADLRLLDDVLVSLEEARIPLHSLNYRQSGIEHFVVAPQTAEITEIVPRF